jgi:hypothetical protein
VNWLHDHGGELVSLVNTVLISIVAMMQKKNNDTAAAVHEEVKKKHDPF